jgi:hypothetical protein
MGVPTEASMTPFPIRVTPRTRSVLQVVGAGLSAFALTLAAIHVVRLLSGVHGNVTAVPLTQAPPAAAQASAPQVYETPPEEIPETRALAEPALANVVPVALFDAGVESPPEPEAPKKVEPARAPAPRFAGPRRARAVAARAAAARAAAARAAATKRAEPGSVTPTADPSGAGGIDTNDPYQ